MDSNIAFKNWVNWFRQASPYINANRNQTLVLALSGDALRHENLENIVHDLALLNSLGVRLIVVFGGRPQIDELLTRHNIAARFHQGLRITDDEVLPHVLEAYGRLRAELEVKLSMGVVNSPMHGARIKLVSGNFVVAKPIGVLEGVDFGHTGHVRRIDHESIQAHCRNNAIVLIPALGYSMAGDIFNLSYEELAAEVAIHSGADKIVFMGSGNGLFDAGGEQVHELRLDELERMLETLCPENDTEIRNQLRACAHVCQHGVSRAYLLSYCRDGALLEELFTRDGSGTLISADEYDEIRSAQLEDVNGIQELILPLEEQGYLVRRSRERLETDLDYFLVDVRDNAIIGCAGLYPFPADEAGELSCFAVADAYRRKGRGDRLLEAIVARARAQNLKRLFVLTTKTEQWFKERGFEVAAVESLPGEKSYNRDRNAKVLVKALG